MSGNSTLRLALLGAPNCGKTALFNALTGGKARVANYPGATVEYAKGTCNTGSGRKLELLDLPGVYGDCGHSTDERVTIDAIHGDLPGERRPQGILVIMDAAQIRTHLHNVLQAKNYGLPMVVVLNMMDIAARNGVEIDLVRLEEEVGVPVVACVAVRSTGRAALLQFLDDWYERVAAGGVPAPEPETDTLKDLQKKARAITARTVQVPKVENITNRLDNIFLHPVFGPLILVALLFVMFQAVYAWADPAMDLIETGTNAVAQAVGVLVPVGWQHDLVVDGVIPGVGAVIVFLPQILILFAFILALEGSGYLARAAFLVDSLMARVGLNGRAFIPLLSSFACAIPGIMAARTIENEKDRLTTILIAPLMTCSARLPVYLIIIGAFIPATKVGLFNLQGLVMFGLYMAGIVFALLSAFILKRTVTTGAPSKLLLEMPSYKIPSLRDYLLGLWRRAMIFINRAGRIILPASIIIWFLSAYPNDDGDIRNSFAGKIGRVLEPVLAPVGFNLEIAIALIPAMAAREVAVSALSIVYSVEDVESETHVLEGLLSSSWSLPVALAFLVWFVFAPQCLSTFAVTRRETNSWKWPLFMFAYLFILAYVAAGATYWIASAAGL